MRVLVTRPLEDARETEAALKVRGHDAVVAPLLFVNFHDGPEMDLAGIQAILATSANGVRALARRTARRDLPLLAVGPQTAEAARESGFEDVKSADGEHHRTREGGSGMGVRRKGAAAARLGSRRRRQAGEDADGGGLPRPDGISV